MGDEAVVKSVLALVLLEVLEEESDDVIKTRGKTREWVKRREEKGLFSNIVKELRMEDTRAYFFFVIVCSSSADEYSELSDIFVLKYAIKINLAMLRYFGLVFMEKSSKHKIEHYNRTILQKTSEIVCNKVALGGQTNATL